MRRVLALVAGLGLMAVACGGGSSPSGTAGGALRYEALGGTTLTVETGRPTVINFFASWCTPCLLEMPDFEKVHQSLGQRVAFLGINVQEDAARATKVKDTTAVSYPIGLDRKGALYRHFGAVGMPVTVILDASGQTAEVHTGALTAKALQDLLAAKVGVT